jgi:AraC-like DNA-binding protein
VVRPVTQDARGIVTPDAGLRRFRLDRFPPGAEVARLVDRYWLARWDLRGRPPHTQHVFAHPVVNVIFVDGGPGMVSGVSTVVTSRTLAGAGWGLGVMFRPAGFRPLLRRSMTTIRDTVLPWADVVGDDRAAALAAAVADAGRGAGAPGAHPDDGDDGDHTDDGEQIDRVDGAAMAAAVEAALRPLVPARRQGWEDTAALVERIAADPAFLTVEDVARQAGATPRQLQRRFADHVGIGPKAVIRRYRLYEAAERARGGGRVDWAAVAASLGYSDQAHLTRDFTGHFGLPPGRYVAANTPA